jgi:hypothetical protein
MPNNKKAWHIRELADKRPDNYSKYAFPYEVCVNVLESSKYGDEFVGISYSSNILNMSKDCQRICSDFIFTVVCSDLQGNLSLDCDGSGSAECNQHWQSKTR